MLLWLAEGQIAHFSLSWIIPSFSVWAILHSLMLLFSCHCTRSQCASPCEGSFPPDCVHMWVKWSVLYEKHVMFCTGLSSHLLLRFSVRQLLPSTLNNYRNTFPGCLPHIFYLSHWLIWKPPLLPHCYTEKPNQSVAIWWALALAKAGGIKKKNRQKLFIYSSISN